MQMMVAHHVAVIRGKQPQRVGGGPSGHPPQHLHHPPQLVVQVGDEAAIARTAALGLLRREAAPPRRALQTRLANIVFGRPLAHGDRRQFAVGVHVPVELRRVVR